MKCPIVHFNFKRCAVVLKSRKPNMEGGTPISEYKYEFNSGPFIHTKKWYHLSRCTMAECKLSTRYFTREVNLTAGDLVNIRASSKNSVGWSNPSAGCATTVPTPISKRPTLTMNEDDQTITAKWKKCIGKSCTYEIFWGIAGFER